MSATHSELAPLIPAAEEYFINVDGIRVRYLRSGSGPPLLLIHGLLGYSFCWRRNFEALGRHFDVIAPDLPGMGFSERVSGLDCSVRAAAQRTLRLLDELGIAQADVLGNSHGGAIATTMAAIGSETGNQRVRRLILSAPVNPWSSHGTLITAALASRAGRLAFPAIWSALRRMRGYILRRMYGDPARIPPGSVEGYVAGLLATGTTEYLLDVVRCWHSDLRDLERSYANINVPVLLMWGDRDTAVLPESAQRVREVVPGAQLVMLPGVGHLPHEEAPETFHRIVLEFLLRPAPDSPDFT